MPGGALYYLYIALIPSFVSSELSYKKSGYIRLFKIISFAETNLNLKRMNQKNTSFSSFPVFLAFLCMGFGDVVGPLTGLIRQEFQLSNLMAQMIPFMGFLMFGLLSIPIGVVQDKYGKKIILLSGLYLALLGLLIINRKEPIIS